MVDVKVGIEHYSSTCTSTRHEVLYTHFLSKSSMCMTEAFKSWFSSFSKSMGVAHLPPASERVSVPGRDSFCLLCRLLLSLLVCCPKYSSISLTAFRFFWGLLIPKSSSSHSSTTSSALSSGFAGLLDGRATCFPYKNTHTQHFNVAFPTSRLLKFAAKQCEASTRHLSLMLLDSRRQPLATEE